MANRNIWLLLLFFVGTKLLAQEEVLQFQQLSANDGLTSQTYNYFIFHDSRHYVWIGSITGMNRFDGKNVVNYQPVENDTLSLSDPNIQSEMFEDREGRIWFNTSKSIEYYEPEGNRFASMVPYDSTGTPYHNFQVIYLDTAQQELWFLAYKHTEEFFYLLKMKVDQENPIPKEIDQVTSFWGYSMKVIPQQNGIFKLLLPQRKGWEIRTYSEHHKPIIQHFLYPNEQYQPSYFWVAPDENLWIGTEKGLVITDWDGVNIEEDFTFNETQIKKVTGIIPYKEALVLITTKDQGLFLFDAKKRRYVSEVFIDQGGLATSFPYVIDRVYLDRDRNLFLSSSGSGVFYANLNRKRFKPYLTPHQGNKASSNVKAIAEGPDGNIWVLTENDLFILSSTSTSQISSGISQAIVALKEKGLVNFFIDQDNQFWVCTYEGIFKFDSLSQTFVPVKNPSSSDGIYTTHIYERSNGEKWVSTFKHGIYTIQEQKGSYALQRLEGISDSSGRYNLMEEDPIHRMFVAKLWNGIEIYDTKSPTIALIQRIPFSPMITAFALDTSRCRMWVASAQGLYWMHILEDSLRLRKDQYFSQLFPNLNGLLIDREGVLWISSTKGLIAYKPDEFEHGNIFINNIRKYGKLDGLQELEFNFWSYHKFKDGSMAFGGISGFNFFHPSEIKNLSLAARPSFSKLLVNGEERAFPGLEEGPRTLTLTPQENSFSLYFSNLDYSGYKEDHFQYFLYKKGGDTIDQGTDTYARYVNLAPDTYQFDLYAANAEGIWNQEPAHLKLILIPHFTETVWFKAFILLSFLAIIWAIYANRLEQARKQQQIAEYKQLFAEAETAVLRVQMNPHFIFNSLNSIRSYIQERDLDHADEYLVQSSRLMRQILNLAPKKLISLSEELMLLEGYMEVEAMRFSQAFQYEFIYEEDLDPDEVMIPPMLLQPFVENSIIHGFGPRKGQGKITLFFKISGDELHCNLEDNGVGRSNTVNNAKDHQSKALSITHKRLTLLENRTGKKTNLQINDLHDSSGKPTGTEIILTLPLI